MQQHTVGLSDDEILTGEALALDTPSAGLLLRALGAAIDLFLTIVVLIAIAVFAVAPLAQFGEVAVRIASISALVLLTVVVPTSVETLSRGRSLGKLIFGVRVVRNDGGAIGFRHAFIRALTGVLEVFMTLGTVAVMIGSFTPRAQRLGDLLAGTYAQRTRSLRVDQHPRPLPQALALWAAHADVSRIPDRLARRISQFLHQESRLQPHARMRIAQELFDETRPWVAPIPDADPVTSLTAIAAVRREREQRALTIKRDRLAALGVR